MIKRKSIAWLLVFTMLVSLVPSLGAQTALAADWPSDASGGTLVVEDETTPTGTITVKGGETFTVTGSGTITGGALEGPIFKVEAGGHLILDGVTISGNTVSTDGAVYVADGGTLELGDKSAEAGATAPSITANTASDAPRNLTVADGANVLLNAAPAKSIGLSYASDFVQPVALVKDGTGSLTDLTNLTADDSSLEPVLSHHQVVLQCVEKKVLIWDPVDYFGSVNLFSHLTADHCETIFERDAGATVDMLQGKPDALKHLTEMENINQYDLIFVYGPDVSSVSYDEQGNASVDLSVIQEDLELLKEYINYGGRVYVQAEDANPANRFKDMNANASAIAQALNAPFKILSERYMPRTIAYIGEGPLTKEVPAGCTVVVTAPIEPIGLDEGEYDKVFLADSLYAANNQPTGLRETFIVDMHAGTRADGSKWGNVTVSADADTWCRDTNFSTPYAKNLLADSRDNRVIAATGNNPNEAFVITGRTAYTLTFKDDAGHAWTVTKVGASKVGDLSGEPGTHSATGLEKATKYRIDNEFNDKAIGTTLGVDAKDIAEAFAPDEETTTNGATDLTEQAENSKVIVTVGEDGNYKVTVKDNIDYTVTIPDNWGTVTVDLNDKTIKGDNATAEAPAKPGLDFTHTDHEATDDTHLNIVDNSENGGGKIVGGDGIAENPNGAPGVEGESDSQSGITVGDKVEIIGGNGADSSDSDHPAGDGGAGAEGALDVTVDTGASVIGGNGGHGADSSDSDHPATDGGNGGNGITTPDHDVTINEGGTVSGGNGGHGGADNDAEDSTAGGGGQGGNGVTDGTGTIHNDGTITGGNGGDGGTSDKGTAGGGGQGGAGTDGTTDNGSTGTISGGNGGQGGNSDNGTAGGGGQGGTGTDGDTTNSGTISGGDGGHGGTTDKGTDGSGGAGGEGSTDTDAGGTITDGQSSYGDLSSTTTTVTVDGAKDGATYTIYDKDGNPVEGVDPVVAKDGSVTFEGLSPNTEYIVKVTDGTNVQNQEVGTITTQPSGGGIVPPDKPDNDIADPDETGVSDWLNTDDHIVYMVGYPDSTFGPSRNITRAEVAAAFYRLLRDTSVDTSTTFPDVDADSWYHDVVTTLAAKGIIVGYEDGSFRPDQPITRAEFSAIASRFAKASADSEVTFSDVDAEAWYYPAVQTAVSYNWVRGYEDGSFRPAQAITRAEAVSIINRMMARIADTSAIDSGAGERFPDVAASHWAFYEITEAATAHDYNRPGNTDEEIWQ